MFAFEAHKKLITQYTAQGLGLEDLSDDLFGKIVEYLWAEDLFMSLSAVSKCLRKRALAAVTYKMKLKQMVVPRVARSRKLQDFQFFLEFHALSCGPVGTCRAFLYEPLGEEFVSLDLNENLNEYLMSYVKSVLVAREQYQDVGVYLDWKNVTHDLYKIEVMVQVKCPHGGVPIRRKFDMTETLMWFPDLGQLQVCFSSTQDEDTIMPYLKLELSASIAEFDPDIDTDVLSLKLGVVTSDWTGYFVQHENESDIVKLIYCKALVF